MIKKINPSIIYFSENVQKLCLRASKSFPNGCKNYGKKPGCPPTVLIDKVLDFSKPVYVIWTEFQIGEYAARMKEKHPKWSEKQCYNSRYWQKGLRKIHYAEIEEHRKKYGFDKVVNCPEGNGVQVFGLMAKLGIRLENPPRKITRIISLAGYSI